MMKVHSVGWLTNLSEAGRITPNAEEQDTIPATEEGLWEEINACFIDYPAASQNSTSTSHSIPDLPFGATEGDEKSTA